MTFSWRKLAPAGNFPSLAALSRAYRKLERLNQESDRDYLVAALEKLGNALCLQSDAEQVYFYGSGSEAIYRILLALKKVTDKNIVALSAYTCPDIVTACLHAGFQVLPVDISPYSLEMDTSTIADEHLEQIAAVVLSNLYGLTDSLEPLKRNKWLLIDDACQGFFSRDENGHVGCRANTIGVVSFSRGKAICGFGGGGVLIGRHSFRKELTKDVISKLAESYEAEIDVLGLARLAYHILKIGGQTILERPQFYALPVAAPFLHLGQTIIKKQVMMKPINLPQIVAAWAQIKEQNNVTFPAHAQLWHEMLQGLEVIEPFIERGVDFSGSVRVQRYPLVLASDEQRDKVLSKLNQFGLGASASYPQAITDYREFQGAGLISCPCPNAQQVAKRIITVPIHKYVRMEDIHQGCQVIRACLAA
ncbi:MAG: DegT/DnrJ/EryC1/StrS aminotransferase family protein [Deltaproteobacteria bacterium]|nr:DegT/DnrJ/EryC1/StrS aminotransferase family protein [Deltaproteobacteria bacterium]